MIFLEEKLDGGEVAETFNYFQEASLIQACCRDQKKTGEADLDNSRKYRFPLLAVNKSHSLLSSSANSE
jgi:hypothetical protein